MSVSVSDVEDILKSIANHEGVIATIVLNPQGVPVRSNLDELKTIQYAELLHNLTAMARNMVRNIDPQDDLTFLRLRSKTNEILVGLENNYLLIVIQNL